MTLVSNDVVSADIPTAVEVSSTVAMPYSFIATDWRTVQTYVVGQIEKYHGKFPRSQREIGIFKGFVNRWGEMSLPIAKVAFEVHGGMWKSAPISVGRFAAASDPFFAEIIARNL